MTNVEYSIDEAARIIETLNYLVANKSWFMQRPHRIDGYLRRLREAIADGQRVLFILVWAEFSQHTERINREYCGFFGPTGKSHWGSINCRESA